MGFVEPITIHQLAESLAVPKLSNDAAKALAPHIDVRLREIIQEACKFARHSKRRTLTTEDINSALRLRNCEPLYGFGGKDPARFVRAAGHPDLFYIEDLEIGTDKVIENKLPSIPVEVGIVPHWLAVEGVQPNIPENVPVEKPKAKRPRTETPSQKNSRRKVEVGSASQQVATQEQTAGSEPAADVVVPPVRLVLSVELLHLLENLKQVIADAKALPDTALGGPFSGFPPSSPDGQASNLPPEVAERLLKEKRALQCLASDPGQHPLAPATIEVITQQVKVCMRQLPQLHLLIKVARSLLKNSAINVERYLDKLISPLMTCIVTKRLGSAPWEDHWSVRSAAANVIAEICATFGARFPNVPQRIVRQFVNAFNDRAKSLPCHYGTIVGLTKLGHRTVQLMLLPYAQPYLRRLEKALAPGNPNEVQRMEAGQVRGALMHACASCMYFTMSSRLSKDFFAQLQPLRQAPAAPQLDFKAAKHNARPAAPAAVGKRKGAAKSKAGKQASLKRGKSFVPKRPRGAQSLLAVDASLSDHELGNSVKNGEKHDANALEDAWREDGDLGKHLAAVHEIFEDAVQPYAPGLPISQVFF